MKGKLVDNGIGLLVLLFLSGCVGQAEDSEKVEYEADSENEGWEPANVEFDTEVDPNASFDFSFDGLPLAGMSFTGAEWGSGGVSWPDRAYSTQYWSFPQFFAKRGLRTARLPFLWERLQPTLQGEFAVREWERVRKTAYTFRSDGGYVILDVHNYARYTESDAGLADPWDGEVVGTGFSNEDFADLWRRLAKEFKEYPEVGFGLMNEPHDIGDKQLWVDAANAAIKAIRDEGAENLIFVMGNSWGGAWSWNEPWTGNSDYMLDIVDPLGDDHLVFEAHQYFNKDSSDWGECAGAALGNTRLQPFTTWLRNNGKRGFIGEFGVQNDSVCLEVLENALTHMEENDDVYVGWAWWAAGPGCAEWQAATDPYCWDDFDWEDPYSGTPSPQLEIMLNHIESNSSIYTNSGTEPFRL